MFRATKCADANITAILHNKAIKTCPGNKIHHLRKKSPACVHGNAPDWKKPKSGNKLPSESWIGFKVPPKKTLKTPLCCKPILQSYPQRTGQQWVQLATQKSPELPNVPLIMDLATTERQRRVVSMILSRQPMGRPVVAPPGIPEDRKQALRRAFDATMADPDFIATHIPPGVPERDRPRTLRRAGPMRTHRRLLAVLAAAVLVLVVAGGAVVLIPGLPLIKIAVFSQVVNGAVLPFVLIFMLLLINKKELMGEYANKRTFNIIAWATTVIMILLTALLLYGQMRGTNG